MRKGSLRRAELRKVMGLLTVTTAAAALAAVAAAVAVPADAAPVWRGATADAPWLRTDFVEGRPGAADEGWDGDEAPGDEGDGGWDDGDGGDGGRTDPDPGDGLDGGDGPGGEDPPWASGDEGDGEVTILPVPLDACGDCIFYTTTDLEAVPGAAPTGAETPGLPRGDAAAAARAGNGDDDACRPLPGRALPPFCQP
jgi:hypothetical protein